MIYNKDGKLLNAWEVNFPVLYAIKVVTENGEDFLYVVDCGWVLDPIASQTNGRANGADKPVFIAKLTLDGKLVFTYTPRYSRYL